MVLLMRWRGWMIGRFRRRGRDGLVCSLVDLSSSEDRRERSVLFHKLKNWCVAVIKAV